MGFAYSGGEEITVPTRSGTDNNWTQLAAGEVHSLGLKTDGTLWAWGRNEYGQLGLGDTSHRNAPVQVGAASDWAQVDCAFRYTMAIKTNANSGDSACQEVLSFLTN